MKHLKMLTIVAILVAFAGVAAAQSGQSNANPPVGPQGVITNNATCACECSVGLSDGTGNRQVGTRSGIAYGPGDGSGVCDRTPQGPGECTGAPTADCTGTPIADCICLCDGSGAGNGIRNGGALRPQPGTGTCPNQ